MGPKGYGIAQQIFFFLGLLLATLVLYGKASASQLDLIWEDTADNEEGFAVERRTGGGAFAQIVILDADVTSYVDANLAADTTYCYRVRALNEVGSSDYSNEACATIASLSFRLTVVKTGTGSGRVDGQGISCGIDCSETYSSTANVSLSATPAADSTFNGWSGDSCSGTDTCTLLFNVDTSVTANFMTAIEGWTSLPGGGATVSAPAAVEFNDALWVFVHGTDNRIYQNIHSGQSWSGWGEVPGGGATVSAPVAVEFNGALWVFVHGTDNRIYQNIHSGQSWSGWGEVPGGRATVSAPAAAVFENTLYLIVRGTDSRIYDNLLTSVGWTGWAEVPGRGATPSGPATAVFNGELWYFVRGTDDHVYQNRLAANVGSGWTGWSEVAGTILTPSGPGAAATQNMLYLFVRGMDNGIYLN